VNKYQWVANSRQGRLRVYIDGKAAGFAPLQGSFRATLAPGSHTVRISLWRWYWSRRVDVDVAEGSTVVLDGDIDRSFSVLARTSNMLFHPLSCMVLKVQAIRPTDERMPDARQSEATCSGSAPALPAVGPRGIGGSRRVPAHRHRRSHCVAAGGPVGARSSGRRLRVDASLNAEPQTGLLRAESLSRLTQSSVGPRKRTGVQLARDGGTLRDNPPKVP